MLFNNTNYDNANMTSWIFEFFCSYDPFVMYAHKTP